MTLADVMRTLFGRHDPPCDEELESLRQKHAVANERYRNGVDAIRALNREGITHLRLVTKKQLESAEQLRRELKSEPDVG